MTPEQIFENFDGGTSTPLRELARTAREVVDAYRGVADGFSTLTDRMPNVWIGEAALGSGGRAVQLITSMRLSADLLDSCAGSHDAQTAAFEAAQRGVVPVPPAPEKPTPMELIKQALRDGPAAPFEQMQTYRDGVAAHNTAAQQNLTVMEEYYWATTDNLDIPTGYPKPEMAPATDGMTEAGPPDGMTEAGPPDDMTEGLPLDLADDEIRPLDGMTEGERDGMTEGLPLDLADDELRDVGGDVGIGEPPAGEPEGVGPGGGTGGGTGGSFSGGSADELKTGGLGTGSGDQDPIDLSPLDPDPVRDDKAPPDWVPRTPPSPSEIPDGYPKFNPSSPGEGLNDDWSRNTGTGITAPSGWSPTPSTPDPAPRLGTPSAFTPGPAGGDPSSSGGQFGPGGSAAGNAPGGRLTGGGLPGGAGTGPAGSPGFGPAGRPGGPAGMGMAPGAGAKREEDKEHRSPEYLFPPDPDELFGVGQATAVPVIGETVRLEPFDGADEDEDGED